MKILFVRHSEPDYGVFDQLENPSLYSGFGRDLAPLTARGRCLAQERAGNPLFSQAQVVISSSVTRALETATYISQSQNLPLLVEPFFHEWRPDLTGQNVTQVEVMKAYDLFIENGGAMSDDSLVRYETAEEMKCRFLQALEKYKVYNRLIIVCHGMLIRQFVPKKSIDYCEVIEYQV